MINNSKTVCKNFIELAYVFLPEKYVSKFETEQDRQIKRDDYFHNLSLYNESAKKQKRKHKNEEEES